MSKRKFGSYKEYWEFLKGKMPKNMEGLKLGHGWNRREQKVEMMLCACGCGKELNKFDKKNRERKYLDNHFQLVKGKKLGFVKGHESWNKGLTIETSVILKSIGQKSKERLLNNPLRYWEGKKRSLEDIEKVRKSLTGRKLTKEHREKVFIKLQAWQLSKKPSSIEKIVYDFLLSKGVIFEKQKLINGKFLVDVYIPEFNLVIEADGKYWHTLDRVMKKDKAENAYLKKCGFNLLRLGEDEINSGKFKERMVV